MKKLLAFFLFLAALSVDSLAATAVDRYCNTDCANNGDGTSSSCAGSPGGAGAYKTAQQGFSDIASDYANFVSSDVQVTLHCEGATADTNSGDTNTGLDITGITTDSTRYFAFTVDSGKRHDGKWNTGKYRIAGGFYYAPIRVRVPFTRISWIQVENSRTGSAPGTYCSGILMEIGAVTAGRIEIKNSILRQTGDLVNCTGTGIEDTWPETSGVTKVYSNNLIYDFKVGGYFRSTDSGALYLYNNTCYSNVGSSTCFVIRTYGTGATYVYKNNLANGSAQGYNIDGGVASITTGNNLSEDTSSPDTSYRSKAVTFVNEGSDDFHLDTSDTNAKDAGADLSAATEGFSIDIDNDTRSGTWDIGADEFVGGGGGGGSAVPVMLNDMGY